MLPVPSQLARRGSFSLLLAAMFLVPRACIEIEETTTFRSDGTGSMEVALRVDEERLQEFSDDTTTASPEEMEKKIFGKLRAALDTVEGVHFDTAWARRDGAIIVTEGRLRFDDAEKFASARPSGGQGDVDTEITADGKMIRVVQRRKSAGQEGGAQDPQAKQFEAAIMKGLMQITNRYVFPAGTEVLGADPAVTRTDTSVVWEIDRSQFAGKSPRDSGYVEVRLP